MSRSTVRTLILCWRSVVVTVPGVFPRVRPVRAARLARLPFRREQILHVGARDRRQRLSAERRQDVIFEDSGVRLACPLLDRAGNAGEPGSAYPASVTTGVTTTGAATTSAFLASIACSASPHDGARDGAGNGPHDSRAERIGAHTRMLDAIAPKVARSAGLRGLLNSYSQSVSDPANELVHLYEVRDALATHYGREAERLCDSRYQRIGMGAPW